MKKSFLALILIVAVVAGAFTLLNHNKEKRLADLANRSRASTEVPVTVAEVEQKNLTRSVTISGVLQAKRQVTILSETSGQIEKYYREVGDAVYQGTPLAVVDASIINAQLETAKANLENAKRDLARFQTLAASGAATQQTVDNLKLSVESANANVIALNKQLANTTIKSPQKGVVVARMIENGSVIGGGSPIYKVADLSQMIMTVGLTENEIVLIKQGMPAKIRIDALNEDFPATINTVGVAADLSGRYSVEVLIKNANGSNAASASELRPDLTGSVQIDLPAKNDAIVIPRNALVNGIKDPKVYLVESGKATLRQIAINSVEGNDAIVQNGLSVGEKVVVTGHQNLAEGFAVRVLE